MRFIIEIPILTQVCDHPYNKWIVGAKMPFYIVIAQQILHKAAGTNFRARAEEKDHFAL